MNNNTPLNYFFLTINFHPNDVLAFEDYISQLRSIIEEETYIWCIEHDNTPKRHFHAVIPNVIRGKQYRDREKLKKFLLSRLNTYLKKVATSTTTDAQGKVGAFNLSDKLDESFRNKQNEDKVGYCAKEFTHRCGGTITPEDKEKHKLIYLNSLKITESTIKNTIEIKPLTIKTALMYMYDFYETYSPPVKSIFSSMIDEGYSFIQISNNQKDSLRNELKLRLHNQEKIKLTNLELEHTKQDIDNISHRDIYEEHDQLKSELENLIIIAQINKQDIPIDDIRKLIYPKSQYG